MNFRTTLSLFLFAFIAGTGCRKIAQTTAGTGSINPAASSAMQTAALHAVTYPYSQLATGTLTVHYDCPTMGYDNTDNKYQFLVVHLSADTMIVKSMESIALESYNAMKIDINDTLTGNSADAHLGAFTFYNPEDKAMNSYPHQITFSIVNAQLAVSWSGVGLPLVGACDYGQSSASFSGTLRNVR